MHKIKYPLAFDLAEHIVTKPHGYPGDHELIGKLYGCREGVGHDPDGIPYSDYTFTVSDRFISSLPEAEALVNRKDMAKSIVQQIHSHNPIESLVDLGCGDGLYLEMFGHIIPEGTFHGVDISKKALDAARKRCQGIQASFSKLVIGKELLGKELPCHVIYSGGLFDYFSDKPFTQILRRIMKSRAPGWLVIGNMERTRDTGIVMDGLGWHIFSRSATKLRSLAISVCEDSYSVQVLTDNTGCQHFLVMERNKS